MRIRTMLSMIAFTNCHPFHPSIVLLNSLSTTIENLEYVILEESIPPFMDGLK